MGFPQRSKTDRASVADRFCPATQKNSSFPFFWRTSSMYSFLATSRCWLASSVNGNSCSTSSSWCRIGYLRSSCRTLVNPYRMPFSRSSLTGNLLIPPEAQFRTAVTPSSTKLSTSLAWYLFPMRTPVSSFPFGILIITDAGTGSRKIPSSSRKPSIGLAIHWRIVANRFSRARGRSVWSFLLSRRAFFWDLSMVYCRLSRFPGSVMDGF
mmetsp:Transcript_8921/g.22038  ORF Transcript_8921/g.22038 Transcript_8921/m.22038 type:complete len:210 (-) Transcript_8921:34-663(-)